MTNNLDSEESYYLEIIDPREQSAAIFHLVNSR